MDGFPRVLGLIQAGGEGSRMDVLTRERAKPALAFAGAYKLIDFPLSSFAGSGIADVWVSVSHLASTLDPYIAQGVPGTSTVLAAGTGGWCPRRGARRVRAASPQATPTTWSSWATRSGTSVPTFSL